MITINDPRSGIGMHIPFQNSRELNCINLRCEGQRQGLLLKGHFQEHNHHEFGGGMSQRIHRVLKQWRHPKGLT